MKFSKLAGFLLLYLTFPFKIMGLPKIVGLAQIRNESHVIEQFLRALALYTDAIVILDDASTDETLSIIRKLAPDLNIELIIENEVSAWEQGFEIQNREKLLAGGRQVGGTHFLFLDADQMFSAECQKNNWLRSKILSLVPGQIIKFPVINVWGSIDKYRNDKHCNPLQRRWLETIAICDDGQCDYQSNTVWSLSKVLHISRWPAGLKTSASTKEFVIKDLFHGVLHYKCVNLEDIPFKLMWYMCLEYIRLNENQTDKITMLKNAQMISNFYEKEYDGGQKAHNIEDARCCDIPSSWYAYEFFNPDVFARPNEIRKKCLQQWFEKYGFEYFENLNIWNNNTMKLFMESVNKSEEYERSLDHYNEMIQMENILLLDNVKKNETKASHCKIKSNSSLRTKKNKIRAMRKRKK